MNKFLVISFVLFLASCVSIKKYNAEIAALHPVENLQKDVDVAYHKLRKLHPKLYQFIAKDALDFKFDSLKQSIQKPMTSADFYLKLAPIVAEVHQGHISIGPPNRKFTKKERKSNSKKQFEFSYLEFEKVNDAFIIKENFGKDSSLVGSEVLLVNGDSISTILNKYKNLFSSDGYNTTFQEKFIAYRFSGFYSKHNGYLDSISLTLRNQDSVFTKKFLRVSKDSTNKKLKKIDSVESKEIVKLTSAEKKLNKHKAKIVKKNNRKYGFIKGTKQYTRNFEFIGVDSTVAYMKIRGFDNGNYKKFYKEVFTKIDSSKTQNLIIDLRDNLGGRLDEIAYLYTFLIDKEHQFIEKGQTLTPLPYLKSSISSKNSFFVNVLGVLAAPFSVPIELLNSSKKDGVRYYKFSSSKERKKPNPLNFKGNIYVLINGNSFSASSIISTNLKATKRALFVGEETGGHYNGTVAGMYKYVKLPNSKVALNFGLIQIQTPYQVMENGYGIKPDVEIVPTKFDRLKGVDPELEWILTELKK